MRLKFYQHRLIGNTGLYIHFCKTEKLQYESLQFPVEMNTRGSKTLTTFIAFHTKYDLQVQFYLAFAHNWIFCYNLKQF